MCEGTLRAWRSPGACFTSRATAGRVLTSVRLAFVLGGSPHAASAPWTRRGGTGLGCGLKLFGLDTCQMIFQTQVHIVMADKCKVIF